MAGIIRKEKLKCIQFTMNVEAVHCEQQPIDATMHCRKQLVDATTNCGQQ